MRALTAARRREGLPDLGQVGAGRVARTASANVAGRVAAIVLGIVTTAVVTRHLGVAGFAAFSYALAFGLLFAPLTDFGLNQAAVSQLARRRHPPEALVGSLLMLRLATGLLFAAGAAVIALLTAPDRTVAVASVVACAGLVLSTPSAMQAVIQTAVRPGWAVVNVLVNSLVWLAVALALALAGAGVVALVVGVVVAGALASATQAALGLCLVHVGRPSRDAMRGLLRLCVPLGIGAIAATVYYRIDAVLLYQLGSADDAGAYAAAYRLVDQVQFLPVAIVGAVFPMVAHAVGDPDRLRRYVHATWEVMAGLGLVLVAVGVAVAHPAAGVLFGPEFRDPTGRVLVVLWPVVLAIFMGYLAGALVPALDLVRAWTVVVFAGAAVNVLLNLALIPPLGGRGAALATLATEFGVMAVTLRMALGRARLTLPVARVGRMAGAAALAGAAAGVAVVAARPGGDLAQLAAGVAFGLAGYVAGLHAGRVLSVATLWRGLRHPRLALRELG